MVSLEGKSLGIILPFSQYIHNYIKKIVSIYILYEKYVRMFLQKDERKKGGGDNNLDVSVSTGLLYLLIKSFHFISANCSLLFLTLHFVLITREKSYGG